MLCLSLCTSPSERCTSSCSVATRPWTMLTCHGLGRCQSSTLSGDCEIRFECFLCETGIFSVPLVLEASVLRLVG